MKEFGKLTKRVIKMKCGIERFSWKLIALMMIVTPFYLKIHTLVIFSKYVRSKI